MHPALIAINSHYFVFRAFVMLLLSMRVCADLIYCDTGLTLDQAIHLGAVRWFEFYGKQLKNRATSHYCSSSTRHRKHTPWI